MQLILIICGISYAKTDACGTDFHPCNCCENSLADCTLPLPDECITVADSDISEIFSYKEYATNYLNLTLISENLSEIGISLKSYTKFLMTIPLLLDSTFEVFEAKTLEGKILNFLNF